VIAAFVAGRSHWLLFAHIAAAFLFSGAVVAVVTAAVASARAREDHQRVLLAGLAYRVNLLVLWPALVILVGAGAQLASSEDAYSRGWLRWGMVLTALVAVVAGAGLAVLTRRASRSPMLFVAGMLSVVALVVIFWLMTTKPGFYQ
jgi:hypothetical protein